MRKKEEQESSPMFPVEIIEEILSRLPVKSLMRFRCVSKQWRSLFMDPAFITKHLNRPCGKNPTHILVEHHGDFYTSEIESGTQMRKIHLLYKKKKSTRVHVEALCDGLVCVSFKTSQLQEVHLFNPVTREDHVLPKDYYSNSYSCFGLGFDPKIKEYKVVKVAYMDGDVSVNINTLSSHKWRRIHSSLSLKIASQSFNTSVTVSGAVHWVAIPKVRSFSRPESLLSFDVQLEVFRKVPLPEFGIKTINFYYCVGILGGCLSVSTYFVTDSIEIWVMKEYGVKESWTKLFGMKSIGRYGYRNIMPLRFCKDSETLLIQKNGIEKNEIDMILYNPKSKIETKLGFASFPCYFTYYSFVESLVCPSIGNRGATKN